MARVAIIFKVYPKEGMLEKAISNIRSKMNPKSMQAEDVAFGIKVIKVLFTFDDNETTGSNIEDQLKKIDGVGEIDVEEETLI